MNDWLSEAEVREYGAMVDQVAAAYDKSRAPGDAFWGELGRKDRLRLIIAFREGQRSRPHHMGAIRICPDRDGPCPHGMECTFWRDGASCDMESSRAAVRQPVSTIPEGMVLVPRELVEWLPDRDEIAQLLFDLRQTGYVWADAIESDPESDAAGLADICRGDADEVLVLISQSLSASPPSGSAGEDGWQDISTAPKDETYIIVFQEGVLEPSQTICAWDASWGRDVNGNSGWWMCCDGKNPELPLRGPDPTHWRPLPAHPHASSDEGTK